MKVQGGASDQTEVHGKLSEAERLLHKIHACGETERGELLGATWQTLLEALTLLENEVPDGTPGLYIVKGEQEV